MTKRDNTTGSSDATQTDSKGFVYEPIRGPRRKVIFRPKPDDRFERIESVWTGCRWRVTGREVVATFYEL